MTCQATPFAAFVRQVCSTADAQRFDCFGLAAKSVAQRIQRAAHSSPRLHTKMCAGKSARMLMARKLQHRHHIPECLLIGKHLRVPICERGSFHSVQTPRERDGPAPACEGAAFRLLHALWNQVRQLAIGACPTAAQFRTNRRPHLAFSEGKPPLAGFWQELQ